MKRFAIKFLAVTLLFFIPVAIYKYYVIPNMSGDLGKLGMIPFGKEYEGLDIPGYIRNNVSNASVVSVSSLDSLSLFPVVTIGDSFSQMEECGYQYKLSSLLNCTIANYFDKNDVLNRYVMLLNADYFSRGQTVIVESVERSVIGRLAYLDCEQQYQVVKSDDSHCFAESQSGQPFLNRFFSWIRLNLNIGDNSVLHFKLSKQCFTHKRFGDILHLYNSLKDYDGDLLWNELLSEKHWIDAIENMQRLIAMSEQKGVDLVILIAADRYDVYEPWIEDDHLINPTLDRLPMNSHVFNTKPCLQAAVNDDVYDVYKINNTHWSVVGADIVANSLYKWMCSMCEKKSPSAR